VASQVTIPVRRSSSTGSAQKKLALGVTDERRSSARNARQPPLRDGTVVQLVSAPAFEALHLSLQAGFARGEQPAPAITRPVRRHA